MTKLTSVAARLPAMRTSSTMSKAVCTR